MAQVLGLSPTGELIVSLVPSHDHNRLLATDIIIAQLRKNIELLADAAVRRRKGQETIADELDVLRELSRVTRIYEDILASDPAAHGNGGNGNLAASMAQVNTTEMEKLRFAAATVFSNSDIIREVRSAAPAQDATMLLPTRRDSDYTVATPGTFGSGSRTDKKEDAESGRQALPELSAEVDTLEATKQPLSAATTNEFFGQVTTTAAETPSSFAVDIPEGAIGKTYHHILPPASAGPSSASTIPQDKKAHAKTDRPNSEPSSNGSRAHSTLEARQRRPTSSLSLVLGTVPTRYIPTFDELRLWVWVPRDLQGRPVFSQQKEDGIDQTWFNRTFLGRKVTTIKTVRATANDLGHLDVTFGTAEDRDEFVRHADTWLGSVLPGAVVVEQAYQVEVFVDNATSFSFLQHALSYKEGKYKLIDTLINAYGNKNDYKERFNEYQDDGDDVEHGIVDENPPKQNSSTAEPLLILGIEWSRATNQTGKKKKKAPSATATSGSMIVSLGSATAANLLLVNGFECRGAQLNLRPHKPEIALLQCLKCGELGHHTKRCPLADYPEKWPCMDCAELGHESRACTQPGNFKCVLCGCKHKSTVLWCPVKIAERAMLEASWPPSVKEVALGDGHRLIFCEPETGQTLGRHVGAPFKTDDTDAIDING